MHNASFVNGALVHRVTPQQRLAALTNEIWNKDRNIAWFSALGDAQCVANLSAQRDRLCVERDNLIDRMGL